MIDFETLEAVVDFAMSLGRQWKLPNLQKGTVYESDTSSPVLEHSVTAVSVDGRRLATLRLPTKNTKWNEATLHEQTRASEDEAFLGPVSWIFELSRQTVTDVMRDIGRHVSGFQRMAVRTVASSQDLHEVAVTELDIGSVLLCEDTHELFVLQDTTPRWLPVNMEPETLNNALLEENSRLRARIDVLKKLVDPVSAEKIFRLLKHRNEDV